MASPNVIIMPLRGGTRPTADSDRHSTDSCGQTVVHPGIFPVHHFILHTLWTWFYFNFFLECLVDVHLYRISFKIIFSMYVVSKYVLNVGLRYSIFCPEQLSSWLSAIRDSTQLDSALSWNCSIQLWLNSNSRQRGVSHHKLQILFSFLSFLFTAYVGLQFIILHSTVYSTVQF